MLTTWVCSFSLSCRSDISSDFILETVSRRDSSWWALERASSRVSVSSESFSMRARLSSTTSWGVTSSSASLMSVKEWVLLLARLLREEDSGEADRMAALIMPST